MNRQTILLWGGIVVLLLQSACQTPTEPEEEITPLATLVRGTVIRSDVLSAVPNALVYDAAGLAADTSKSDGSFTLRYELTGPYVGKVIGTRVGFGNDTVNVSLRPGRDTTIVIRLKADSTSPATGSLSGKAASIFLIGATSNNIGIRGTGSNETSQLTFEVRDSVGVPVSGTNKVNVSFSILGGPGGGEFLFPVSQVSDALTGRVSTRVTSGSKAGVIQVFASAVVDGNVIRSAPVRITISGGFPVQERFSISREKVNILGGLYDNLRNRVQVIVGDKDGNPVQPGTAVYFTTTGGIIQPSALTDASGIAAVDLITSNPRPPGGIAVVTAKTVSDSGRVIQDSTLVVFSGFTQIEVPTEQFEISDSGSYTFSYRVSDANGNPLVAGTNISVQVSGPAAPDLELLGDVNVTLPDTYLRSYTTFTVTIRDRRGGGLAGPVTVTVAVTSENGNLSRSFSGELKAEETITVVPPSAREPAQIRTFAPSETDIFVAGVGERENSVLRYQVLDSLGTPITKNKRAFATFHIEFYPNSFVSGGLPPTLIPPADSTDDSGNLRVSVKSGTQAGVVQIVARILLSGGRVIVSQPVKVTVHAGFPTRSHFTFRTNSYSFGIQSGGFGPSFFVQVGDTFSNPVAPGTAVYFHSQAGVIQTGRAFFNAYTDPNGRAAVTFLGGNPEPSIAGTALAGRPTYYLNEGYFWMWAQTKGRDDVDIIDSLLALWCVPPITVTGLPDSVSVPRAGTSPPITISIRDGRGNPLPVGTRITTRIEFTSDLVGIKFGVSGDLSTTLAHTITNYPAVIYPGPGVTEYRFSVSDLSSSGGAPVGQTMIVNVTIEAPNLGSRTVSFPARII